MSEQTQAVLPSFRRARRERIDHLGALASSLCAVHCAAVALLPALLGTLGLGVLLKHETEWVFTAIAIGFATLALTFGWRRHRSFAVAGVMAMGIVGLLASRGLEMRAEREPEPAAAQSEEMAPNARVERHERARATHLQGTAIGIMASLVLLGGHVLNLRGVRACRDVCA